MRAPVLLAIVLASCSAKGETCSKSFDCGVGLVCQGQVCVDPTDTAKNMAVTIAGAVLQYKVNKRGDCPKDLYQLQAAGFIASVGRDPWGNAWILRCPGEQGEVDVISVGPDHEPGTKDDISNHGSEAESL